MTERGFAVIGLWRPKCSANVGGVLRAAHCFGAAGIVIAGDRFKRASTDTTRAARHIPVQHNVADLMDACPVGAVPVAVEFVDAAADLRRFEHPSAAFYLFGPEDGSLPPSIIRRCPRVVMIPTAFCLNLAAAVNVVLYDRMMKRGGDRYTPPQVGDWP